MRLDKAIFQRGLVQSRSRAALLIEEGSVLVNGETVLKASREVSDADEISVTDSIGYVGRGGLKLEHALKTFSVSADGKDCLDIGASTGGFTQCLLNNGAKRVVAVDVGHGQMHESIASDKRVVLFENTNARFITADTVLGKKDLIVMDVSFISQTEIYPAICDSLKDEGTAITLVKPQFEAGSRFLNKKGIVKDKKAYYLTFQKLLQHLLPLGLGIFDCCPSSIKGGDGNVEFLILIKKGVSTFDSDEFLNKWLKGDKN